MGKFLKPIWHWRCEFCRHEWMVTFDKAGNAIQPVQCRNPRCRKLHWLTGNEPALPAVVSTPAKRLPRTGDSVRMWFYDGRHSKQCPCVSCQKRLRRGLPPGVKP